jgi:hypothetical protein
MKVFILGAGASVHAGYPLASNLGLELAKWVEETKPIDHEYRILIDQVRARLGNLDSFEELLINLDSRRFAFDKAGAEEEKITLASLRPGLEKAICEYFDAVRKVKSAEAYECLAENHIHTGDVIITFNYDVSLDRELRKAGKWEIGNGYGFDICRNLTPDSRVRLLKLHGSTNWRGQLFGGSTDFGVVSPDAMSLGFRPVIPTSEIEYLGYPDLKDPRSKADFNVFALILPAHDKRFFNQTSYGHEWEKFWNCLWHQAQRSLERADQVFMLGYSLPSVDHRARTLVFGHTKPDAQIEVCCREESERIARDLRAHGFSRVLPLNELTFEEWVHQQHS